MTLHAIKLIKKRPVLTLIVKIGFFFLFLILQMWQDIESVLLEEVPTTSNQHHCAIAAGGGSNTASALGHPSGGVDPLAPSVSVHYHHYHPIHHPIAAHHHHHQMSLVHPGFQPQHNNNNNHHHQVYNSTY